MIRLFTALEIPAPQADRISMLQSGLRGARWISRDFLHITLRYMGEVDERMAWDIDRALSEIHMPPVDISLEGIGQFGNKRPHSVWLGVNETPELLTLQARQEQAMQKIGLPAERRKYTPHVTLGRLKRGQTEPSEVMRYIEANNLFFAPAFKAPRFVLMSSKLSQGGGPYITEREYPLMSAEDPNYDTLEAEMIDG
ncbi:MAG: 2'-5' RNA ligase [Parvibaculaceae bacterium]|jgi:2'-5' RNA ligase